MIRLTPAATIIGPPTMKIIAHRGASFDAPENTLAAITLALRQKADGVEVDVQLSRDGRLVVFHDANTKRVSGKNHRVADLRWRELCKLDAGSWKGEKWKGEKIPDLKQVLKVLPRKKTLLVEIKSGPQIIPVLQKLIRNRKPPAQNLIFIGFNLKTMTILKRQLPDHQVLWIYEGRNENEPIGHLPALLPKVIRAKLDGLDFSGRLPLSRFLVQQAKKLGLKVYIWTVDNPKRALNLKKMGVNGVTTNRPGWLRAQIN